MQTPLCLDESIRHLRDAQTAIELGAARIKLGRVGGHSSAREIQAYCLAKNIPVWYGGMLECGIGRAHNIAVSSLPGYLLPGDVSASKRYWIEDVIEPEAEVSSQGTIRVPDTPVSAIMSAVTSSSVGPSKKKPGARGSEVSSIPSRLFCFALLLAALSAGTLSQTNSSLTPGPKPHDAPKEWKELVGIYSGDQDKKRSFILLEQDGKLLWRDEKGASQEFRVLGSTVFVPSEGTNIIGHSISRDDADHVHGFCYLNFCYERKDPGADPSRSYHITTVTPVSKLRAAALAATPPDEKGPFRKPELVELTTLDPAVHLDIRYATANDFLGVPVYTQARAFLQRPAAEALLRVLQKLKPLGYGLLIHDGYRPWYVTKIFWDATPPEGKIFVADPAQGSRHNRGCAVDLTLYDLKTGQAIEMTGGYDEMSPRSFPNYPGGTSLQRWHRDLLRRAMESEGFTVYEVEWWHFDYKDWREYGILNVPFEKLGIGSPAK